jgi:hypothetical protein
LDKTRILELKILVMTLRFFLPFALALFVSNLSAQTQKYNSLMSFTSPIDSALFNGQDLSLLEKFQAIKPTISQAEINDHKNRIADFCSEFHKLDLSKNRLKQLKIIFEKTHSVFLKRYREQIFFPSVFENGEYNCVTASMLYVLILEELKLPYAILEEPNHVYVVVYPDEDYIIFETTSPVFSEQQIPLKQRKQVVDNGLKYKMITQEEVLEIGLNRAYEEIMQTSKRVNLSQLISFQYQNKLVYEKCESNLSRCLQTGYRCLSFSENQELKENMSKIAIQQFVSGQFQDEKLYKAYLVFSPSMNLDSQILTRMYEEVLDEYYMEDLNDRVFSSEKWINDLIDSAAIKNAYLEVLYGVIINSYDDDELPDGMTLENYTRKLIAINPTSTFLEDFSLYSEEVFVDDKLMGFFETANFDAIVNYINERKDTLEVLSKINLKQIAYSFTEEVDDMIYVKEITKALNCIHIMQRLEETYSDFKIDRYKMSYHYIYIGDYYIDKGNKTMAKKILKEGHEKYPEQTALKARYLNVSR